MKKLTINKETVRALNVEEAGEVGGGYILYRTIYTCACPIVTFNCTTLTITNPPTTVTTDTTGPISIISVQRY